MDVMDQIASALGQKNDVPNIATIFIDIIVVVAGVIWK
jgi:hypothetical protein